MEPPRPRSRRRILYAAVSTLALALGVGLWKYQAEPNASPQAAMQALPAVGDQDIERRGYSARPTPPTAPTPPEVVAPPPAEPVAAQPPITPPPGAEGTGAQQAATPPGASDLAGAARDPSPDRPTPQPVATPKEAKSVPARAAAEPRPTRVRVAVRHSVKKPAVEPPAHPPSEKEDAPDWMVMAPQSPPTPDLLRGTNDAPILD